MPEIGFRLTIASDDLPKVLALPSLQEPRDKLTVNGYTVLGYVQKDRTIDHIHEALKETGVRHMLEWSEFFAHPEGICLFDGNESGAVFTVQGRPVVFVTDKGTPAREDIIKSKRIASLKRALQKSWQKKGKKKS